MSRKFSLGRINFDTEYFDFTLYIALVIMIVVMIFAGVIWGVGSSGEDTPKIIFITPRTIVLEKLEDESNCLPSSPTATTTTEDIARCYKLEEVNWGTEYHPLSLVRLTGIILLAVAFLTVVLTYGRDSAYDVLHQTGPLLITVLRNILIAIALTLFLFIVFVAFDFMGGLAAVDISPTAISPVIAVLTIGAFIAVISFRLMNWFINWDIVEVSSASVIVLIVSYALSTLFTTYDWSSAYSRLGYTNNASFIAGYNGSRGLFLFAMVSLGLIFWTFSLDAFFLLKKYSQVEAKFWLWFALILGFLAGIGTMIVGIIPGNENSILHGVGAYGSAIISSVMMLVLAHLYPKIDSQIASNSVNRKEKLWFVAILLVVALILIVAILLLFGKGVLEAELVFFIFFLLYIQLYAQELANYIDDVMSVEEAGSTILEGAQKSYIPLSELLVFDMNELRREVNKMLDNLVGIPHIIFGLIVGIGLNLILNDLLSISGEIQIFIVVVVVIVFGIPFLIHPISNYLKEKGDSQ